MMDWLLFLPEIHVFFMAAVFFTLAMMKCPRPGRDFLVALMLSAAAVVVCLASARMNGSLFAGVYRVDLFSQVFKVILAMGLFLIVCLCSELNSIRETRHPEFYLLLSIGTLGMMILVSSVELLTIYVALELTSYSLYILVALRKGFGSHMEAGIKYFLVGATSSAVMLFGLALLYGAVRTTYLSGLMQALPAITERPMAFAGLFFALSGFFFKLALFPFHVWAPGVYQAAANPVTAYIATATKVAAVAILTRMAAAAGSTTGLVHALVILAIASMTLGNLAAMVQKDMKRLLAYSTIAHAGYVLIGILSMNESGYAGAIYYALAYLIMNFTCFLVVVRAAYDGGDLTIAQLAGLHHRSPLLAMALLLGVFSLGGLPPTIGFTAKFLVFTAAMQNGYFYLVFIGMINVAVSLYYYALVVKAAFLQEPEEKLPLISLPLAIRLLTAAMAILIVAGGMFPGPIYTLAKAAARLLI